MTRTGFHPDLFPVDGYSDFEQSGTADLLSTGCDAEETNRQFMEDFEGGQNIRLPEMKARMKDFVGGYATEAENAAGIRHLYDETGYIIDTHTGVASCVYKKYVKETGETRRQLSHLRQAHINSPAASWRQ